MAVTFTVPKEAISELNFGKVLDEKKGCQFIEREENEHKVYDVSLADGFGSVTVQCINRDAASKLFGLLSAAAEYSI